MLQVLIRNRYKKQFLDIGNFFLENVPESTESDNNADMNDKMNIEEDVIYSSRQRKDGLLISITDDVLFDKFKQFLLENKIVAIDMGVYSSKRKNEDMDDINVEEVESSKSGKKNKKFDVELHKLEQDQTLEEYIEDINIHPKSSYGDSSSVMAVAKLQKIAFILENKPELLALLDKVIPTKSKNGMMSIIGQERENLETNSSMPEAEAEKSKLEQLFSVLSSSNIMSLGGKIKEDITATQVSDVLKQLQKIMKPNASMEETSGVSAVVKEQIKYAKTNDENNRRRIRVLAEFLEERIQAKENKPLDTVIDDIKKQNKRELPGRHFTQLREGELLQAEEVYKEYPAELERRMLLHENITEGEEGSEITRLDILDAISTILRPYREEIKELFGADAQIKFRGSLVRGLKAYPKEGVPPTLNNYDCDAFIEISDELWSDLKKLSPAAEMRKEGSSAVSFKPLRDYESTSRIVIGHQGNKRPKPKTEMLLSDEKEMREKLNRLMKIEEEVRAKILLARGKDGKGKLAGYSMESETTPEFELYIRPHQSVAHLYTEENPYPRYMIQNRGYPILAQELPEREIKEFRPDQYNRFKRNVIPTFLDQKDYQEPKAVTLEEYQIVIGARTWYVEDKYLYDWKQQMYKIASRGNKLDVSRRGLPIYSESLPLIERPYLRPESLLGVPTDAMDTSWNWPPGNWTWPKGRELRNRSQQEMVNDYFELAYKRRPLGWRRTPTESQQSIETPQSKQPPHSMLSKKSASLDAANKNLDNQKSDPSYQLQSHDINYIGEYLFRDNKQYPNHYFLPVQQSHLSSLPTAGLRASLQSETVHEALAEGNSILSVFNRGANHWIAFKISETNKDQLTVYYKDSLGEDRYKTGVGAKCPEFEKEVSNAFPDKKINFVHSVLSEQRVGDSVNCGIFALENLKCLAKEQNLDHCVEENAFNENIVFYKPQNDYVGTLQQARAAYAQIYKIRSDEMLENAELRGKSIDFWQNKIANHCLEIFTGADPYLLDKFNAGEFKVEAQFKFNMGEEWRLNLIFKQSMNDDVGKMVLFLKEKEIEFDTLKEGGVTKLVINTSNAEKLLDQLRVNPESAAIYAKPEEQKIKLV